MAWLLWADKDGRIQDHPYLEMAGFSAYAPRLPEGDDLVPLPDFSKIFFLPDCPPLGFNRQKGRYERVDTVKAGGRRFPAQAVAAFMAPGWVRTLLPAADYRAKKVILPMWGYTAVGLDDETEDYVVPAFQIEDNPTWNPANFDDLEVEPALDERMAGREGNRLYEHLADCALVNHCFAAKNLFLGRWEAPLPVSRACNARCLGCISLQAAEGPQAPQHRIEFTPRADEVVEVALDHLALAPAGIVSFGQGCEGDPLTEADLIERSIQLIRERTDSGTINLNTNGSLPNQVARLADAGLDSIRVSLVSAREDIYKAYTRPQGYGLAQVRQSLSQARRAGLFTMINYLVFPGLSDQEDEIEALLELLKATGVQFVHLKNLCIDPDYLLSSIPLTDSPAIGMDNLADILQREIPELRLGYFNQPAKKSG